MESVAATAINVQTRPTTVKDSVHVSHFPEIPHHQGYPKIDTTVTIGSNLGSSNAPSGFSYTTIHKDGSQTTYSDSNGVQQNVATYAESNLGNINEKERDIVEIQQVKNPRPLPSFIANRFENIAATAINAKVPPSNVPSGFSYTTLHKDGTKSTFTGSDVIKQNVASVKQEYGAHINENIKGHYHGSQYCEDNSHVTDISKGPDSVLSVKPSLGGFSYQSVHNDGSVTTYSDVQQEQDNKQWEQTHIGTPIAAPQPPKITGHKSVVNQYNYEQISHNGPIKTTVVNRGDVPNYDGFVNIESSADKSTQTDYDNFSHNFGTVTHQSDLSSYAGVNVAVPTPSDNSLSNNPIVVLPDTPTYSYEVQKSDGSSVSIVGDKEHVAVIEKTTTESAYHRGDIPDIAV
jgi:hypothetical protein